MRSRARITAVVALVLAVVGVGVGIYTSVDVPRPGSRCDSGAVLRVNPDGVDMCIESGEPLRRPASDDLRTPCRGAGYHARLMNGPAGDCIGCQDSDAYVLRIGTSDFRCAKEAAFVEEGESSQLYRREYSGVRDYILAGVVVLGLGIPFLLNYRRKPGG